MAVGTSVQSYPFKTLVTASFISLLSGCGDGVDDIVVAELLLQICKDAAAAAAAAATAVVVTDDDEEDGERDKEPEPSISKISSLMFFCFLNTPQFNNDELIKPPV